MHTAKQYKTVYLEIMSSELDTSVTKKFKSLFISGPVDAKKHISQTFGTLSIPGIQKCEKVMLKYWTI